MTGNGDEPDFAYGLLASTVRYSRRQTRLSFPTAARGALCRRVKSSRPPTSPSHSPILKTKGHPIYAQLPERNGPVSKRRDETVAVVRFVKGRSRDAHLHCRRHADLLGGLVEDAPLQGLSTLDAPLGSGAYKAKTIFEQGRFIEFELRR